MSQTRPIIVTGATGKQGGAVIDAVLAQQAGADAPAPPFTLLAVTRNPDSAAARALAARAGVTVIKGDYNAVPALYEAAAAAAAPSAVYGVFLAQDLSKAEAEQGKAMVDGALGAGVRHFVYSSVDRGGDEASWANPTAVGHFQSKHEIEQHLRARAGHTMDWTVLRPVAFYENLVPGMQTSVFLTALRRELAPSKPLAWVSTADIGVFAAKAFADPAGYRGRALALAGDDLTMPEFDAAFERVTGKPAPATFGLLGAALRYAGDFGAMLRWFGTDGYRVDVPKLKQAHPGLINFETWLKEKSAFAKA